MESKEMTIEKPKDILKPMEFQQPKAPEKAMHPGDVKKARQEKNSPMLPPKNTIKPLPYSASTMKPKKDEPLGHMNPLDYPEKIELGEESEESPWDCVDVETPVELSQMLKETDDLKRNAPSVLSETGNPYHPDPIQAIKYVSYLAKNSDTYLKTLVSEMKNNGGLADLISELNSLPKFI